MMYTVPENVEQAVRTVHGLKDFIGPAQRQALIEGCQGEEGEWFSETLIMLAERIAKMPHTYAQDGLGDDAVVWLHYFHDSMDWYITEKDIDAGGEGQIQTFGLADFGHGGKLGYISLDELIGAGVQLDMHFTPTTLRDVRK